MESLIRIADSVIASFEHTWPLLLVTIPLAVAVNVSGASKYLGKALGKNPYLSIILATAIGAFSPFCSCGVIPVITSLLIGGAPLAPVMSFWIASPSMDPEIFSLSVASIGWELSVWRLAATCLISLSAGLVTHFIVVQGWIGDRVLRNHMDGQHPAKSPAKGTSGETFRDKIHLGKKLIQLSALNRTGETACCLVVSSHIAGSDPGLPVTCNSIVCSQEMIHNAFWRKLLSETWKATFMVTKFMALAFTLNALIAIYLPQDLLTDLLEGNTKLSVLVAAAIGIPLYTSNLAAMPIAGSLLNMGLSGGAVLSFLIAGPVTTLPAMSAVFGIVKPRVFIIYLAVSCFGAIFFGLFYNMMH